MLLLSFAPGGALKSDVLMREFTTGENRRDIDHANQTADRVDSACLTIYEVTHPLQVWSFTTVEKVSFDFKID